MPALFVRLSRQVSGGFQGLPRLLWVLLAGMLVNRLASFVATFLALYLIRERGFTPDRAGRVVALFGLGVLIAGPLGGTLADALGRRATMLLSLVSGAVVIGALGFARAPWLLGLCALLAALTSELYRPAVQAAIADVVPPEDRARAYGLLYWTVNLGWTLGLLFAGLVAERSFLALFLADAATCLVFAGLVYLAVPETRPAVALEVRSPLAGMGQVLGDRVLLAVLGLHLLALIVFTQFQLAAPVDMGNHGLGPRTFSGLMAVNGLGVVLLQPLLTPALSRVDSGRLLSISALLFGLGFGLCALADAAPLAVYLGSVALWTLGEIVGFPVIATVVAELAPRELRGRYQGAFSMTWGLAFTLSPLLGGEVLARFGAPTLWLCCLGLGALVAIGHLRIAPARRAHLSNRLP